MQKWEYRELKHFYHDWEKLYRAGARKTKVGNKYKGPEEGWYWGDGVIKLDFELAEMPTEKRLSSLGAQGWECFSVVTSGKYSNIYTYYFKRPLPE